MSSKVRTMLAIAVCLVVVLAVLGFMGKSQGWYGQSDSERYRPSPEALRKMSEKLPPGSTPYGQPPKPGEVRPPPPNGGD